MHSIHLRHLLVDAGNGPQTAEGRRGLGVSTGVLGGRGRDGDTASVEHVVTQRLLHISAIVTGGQPAIVTGSRGRKGPEQGAFVSLHRFNLIHNWNKLMALRLLLRSKVIAGQICCAR